MSVPKAYAALPFLADPQREAEDARLQEIRQASHGRGKLTAAERTVARGLALAEIAAENIRIMTRDNVSRETVDVERAKLAEGLALSGRYREAADVAQHPDLSTRYTRIADAIDLDDDDGCGCPETTEATVGEQTVLIPTRHIRQRVFSLKHGGMVEVEACVCGHRNARRARGVLSKALGTATANHAAIIANRVAVASGQRPTERLIADGGVLRS